MFGDTVTLYNKYKGEDGSERWKRTVLPGVFWNAVRGAVMRRTGVSTADSVQLIIPCSVRAESAYAAPHIWQQLTDKQGAWTLQPGDTVLRGASEYEVERSSKELTSLGETALITAVDIKGFGGGMAHFEVSGK